MFEEQSWNEVSQQRKKIQLNVDLILCTAKCYNFLCTYRKEPTLFSGVWY